MCLWFVVFGPSFFNCSNAKYSHNRCITWISGGFDTRVRLHLMWNVELTNLTPFFLHPPFLIFPPFFRNMHPPCLSWHSSWENTRLYDDTPESWETENNQYNAMETYYLYKMCFLSTEYVLIDIVTISIAVDTGCNTHH